MADFILFIMGWMSFIWNFVSRFAVEPIFGTPQNKFAAEHQRLFAAASVRPERVKEIDGTLDKLLLGRARYEKVASSFDNGLPWWFVLITHAMEAGSFTNPFLYHLHCGDPLTARTVHIPKNRPAFNPMHGTRPPSKDNPYSWEESAIDALQQFGDHKEKDWSIGAVLWREEQFNGLGYRKYHKINTPYVWSYTNQYGDPPNIGKYVKDGVWDGRAISKQPGCAAYLLRLKETHVL